MEEALDECPTSSELLGDVVVLETKQESLGLSSSCWGDFVLVGSEEQQSSRVMSLGADLLQLLCVEYLSMRDALALLSCCRALWRMACERRSLWHALLVRDGLLFVLHGERLRRETLSLSGSWTVLARKEDLLPAQMRDAYTRARRFTAARERVAVPFCVQAFDFRTGTVKVLDAMEVMTGEPLVTLRTGHMVSVVVHLYSAAPKLHVLTSLARWSYGLELFKSLGLSGHASPLEADRERSCAQTVECDASAGDRGCCFSAQLLGRPHGAFSLWTLPKTAPRKTHYKLQVYASREALVERYPGCCTAEDAAVEPSFELVVKFEA